MPIEVNGRLIKSKPVDENSPEYKQALDIAFRARLMEEYKMMEEFLAKQRKEQEKSAKKNPGGSY